MIEDKRKNPRLDFEITVRQNGKRGMTGDISQSGTFIRMDHSHNQSPLSPVGSDISFSLDFPTAKEQIDVKGVVVHHGKNGNGMGIYFRRIDEGSQEFIKKFISDYL